MVRHRVPHSALAVLLLCAAAVPGDAAPIQSSPKAQAKAALIIPLTVTKLNDMDFGYLAATTAGTAVLNPNTNALSTTGGVTAVGGSPTAANFLGAAQDSQVVNIKLPNSSLTLKRVGGIETMVVDTWTLQGVSKRSLARMESFTFRVGATLHVAANQVEGLYEGTFDITVQYP